MRRGWCYAPWPWTNDEPLQYAERSRTLALGRCVDVKASKHDHFE